MQEVAKAVSRNAFGREEIIDIDLLAQKRRDFFSELPSPWLTVCIDDVQKMSEAKPLIEQAWSSWGIRLVLTVPPPVAQALKIQFGRNITIVEVKDFSIVELQKYLTSKGHEWSNLPVDVRTILRRPLLAKLYCDIAPKENWHPTNEYALFSRYWQRIRDDHNQVDYPHDTEMMRRLASTLLCEDTAYPWTQSECINSGITAEIQKRLESVGWLRQLGDNRIEVTHYRLMNWAVAEAIISKRLSQEWSVDDVANCVSRFFGFMLGDSSKRMLSYVPMDVCWLMGEPNIGLKDEVPKIIEALDEKLSLWRSETLYQNLLPTLGPRIIEPAIKRIRNAAGTDERLNDSNLLQKHLSETIIEIGKQYPNEVADWGPKMLDDDCEVICQAGCYILKHFPNANILDQLWGIHKIIYEERQKKEGKYSWLDYNRSFAAMKSCIRLKPQWLEQRIVQSPKDSEPFSELAFLLASLNHGTGSRIWKRVKDALFEKIPLDKPRCLVVCIKQYADNAEISRLEGLLEYEGDFTCESALDALAYLDPLKAIAALPRLKFETLYPTRGWWLPGLLLRFPNETRQQICTIIENSDQPRWKNAIVYQENPNQMDEYTLNLLLDELESFAKSVNESQNATKQGFHIPLKMLSDVTQLSLLKQFEARAGTALEDELAELICSWGGRETLTVVHELRYATQILQKIAGAGLTKIVNMQLASASKFARLDGIQLSLVRPDSQTRKLLIDITQSPDSWKKNDYYLQKLAAIALAALGENAAVVESILRWGNVLRNLPIMRARKPPMADGDLVNAIKALESPDENEQTNALFALSVSGRNDFLPQIRQILSDADPESQKALAATWALRDLGDSHPESLSLLEKQLAIPNHAYAASLALLQNSKSESLEILEKWLLRQDVTADSAASNTVAMNLIRHEQTRKTVVEMVWKSIQEGSVSLFHMRCFMNCPLEINSPEVQDFLNEQAHMPEQCVHVVGQKEAAIQALAKLDRHSAFQAAKTALCCCNKDLERYPNLLIDIDETRALPVLLEAYSRNLPTFAKWAIARSMRYFKDPETVRLKLHQMMQSDSQEDRVCAVEISGWLPPEGFNKDIHDIATTDPIANVRQEAVDAFARNERQQFALELLQALEETHGSRCWSYLDAVVRLSDPWILTTPGDPLYIWDRLSEKSPELEEHASDLIEKRIKKVKEEAEKLDRAKS